MVKVFFNKKSHFLTISAIFEKYIQTVENAFHMSFEEEEKNMLPIFALVCLKVSIKHNFFGKMF